MQGFTHRLRDQEADYLSSDTEADTPLHKCDCKPTQGDSRTKKADADASTSKLREVHGKSLKLSPNLKSARKRDAKAEEKEESKNERHTLYSMQQSPRRYRHGVYQDSQEMRTTKRPRKSQDQIDALWRLYERSNGLLPSRDEMNMIAEAIGLKSAQITKWFWDTDKKIKDNRALAKQIGQNPKDFVRDLGKESNSCSRIDGIEGHKDLLSSKQIKRALRINQTANDIGDDLDEIVRDLNIEMDGVA